VDEPAEAPLREGRDFTTPQELTRKAKASPGRTLSPARSLAFAAAVLEEILWMLWTGAFPGGMPWDDQPAWRVALWETFFIEWERASALAADLR